MNCCYFVSMNPRTSDGKTWYGAMIGKEYVKWLCRREGENAERDVLQRLIKAGYDGVRIEYDGGVVDYVASSNKNMPALNWNVTIPILPMLSQQKLVAKVKSRFILRRESKLLLGLAKRTVEKAIEQGEDKTMRIVDFPHIS